MGIDIHIRLLKYDENTNLYKEIALYRKSSLHEKHPDDYPEMMKVPVYDGRDYEMFDGMKDGDDNNGYGYFPWTGMKLNSYEEAFRNEMIEKQKTELGYFDFYEIPLAEMRVYVLENPKVVDYDSEYDEGDCRAYRYKDNPIASLYSKIISYLSFAEPWGMEYLSDYKVVFYFYC